MFTSIILPILIDHGMDIAAPFVAVAAAWIAARIHNATGVKIDKELSELFNAVLTRAAEAVVREGASRPVEAVMASIRSTNPDLVKSLKLDKAKTAEVFVTVATRAVSAAMVKQGMTSGSKASAGR